MPGRQLSVLLILIVALPITALGQNPPPDTGSAAAAARTNQKLDSLVALNTRLVNSEMSETDENPTRDIAMAVALALVGLALIAAWVSVRKLEIAQLNSPAGQEATNIKQAVDQLERSLTGINAKLDTLSNELADVKRTSSNRPRDHHETR